MLFGCQPRAYVMPHKSNDPEERQKLMPNRRKLELATEAKEQVDSASHLQISALMRDFLHYPRRKGKTAVDATEFTNGLCKMKCSLLVPLARYKKTVFTE